MQDRTGAMMPPPEGQEDAGLAMNNYMVMQGRQQQQGILPQGGPLGALRQIKDSKKSEW